MVAVSLKKKKKKIKKKKKKNQKNKKGRDEIGKRITTNESMLSTEENVKRKK